MRVFVERERKRERVLLLRNDGLIFSVIYNIARAGVSREDDDDDLSWGLFIRRRKN